MEHLLELQSLDPDPAQALLERYEGMEYPLACTFGDARLEIDEGVFAPTLTSASPFLLEHVDFKSGERMLDAFAGSGAFGIHAALQGATVMGFDVSPGAVACAQKNATLNNVADQVEVRQGTLEECLAPCEQFDLITANPPLIPLQAGEGLESALFDPGLQATKQFIAALPSLLASRGRCYLLTSDVIDREGYECNIAALCREAGLKLSTVAQLHKEYESYRVHKIEHRRLAWRLRPFSAFQREAND